VLANIERVANLFLTKTVYSVLLALLIGIVGLPFPFLPRQVTLVASLTIGIPGFFSRSRPRTNEPARISYAVCCASRCRPERSARPPRSSRTRWPERTPPPT
jgi:magnesium-transporting ATPase (P-type)